MDELIDDPIENSAEESIEGSDIGYCNPPKETRFKKGTSGNPKGRPKGSKNLATSFFELGREKVTVMVGGRRLTMSVSEAIFRQTYNSAASGDRLARRDFFQAYKIFQPLEPTEEIAPELSEAHRGIVKSSLQRMQRMAKTLASQDVLSKESENEKEKK